MLCPLLHLPNHQPLWNSAKKTSIFAVYYKSSYFQVHNMLFLLIHVCYCVVCDTQNSFKMELGGLLTKVV